MTKRQKEQQIHKAIKDGVRLTEEQVRFAGEQGICLWGSVNYEEHEQRIRRSREYRQIASMSSVVDNWDHEAYQKFIYDNGWNR